MSEEMGVRLWFQSEWEALEIVNHHWALESVEEELICRDLNFGGMFSHELKTTMFWLCIFKEGFRNYLFLVDEILMSHMKKVITMQIFH